MKWVFGRAWLGLVCLSVYLLSCLPASAITSKTHKRVHPKAVVSRKAGVTRTASAHRRKSALHHAKTVTRPVEESSRSGLQTASFHPLAGPQSGGSSSTSKSSSSPSNMAQPSSKKKAAGKKKKVTRRGPTQMTPTPDRVSEIQSALARGGYYKADPNGKLDGDTVDALQKFQAANGLDSTGKLDALTLQKLGLGSDVAGYSSPKGIVPHSCCSMTPSPPHSPTTSQTAPASSASTGAPAANTPASNAAPPAYQDSASAAASGSAAATQQNETH